MINLPPAELLLLRALKKAAVLLFVFRQVDPEPLTGKEIASLLEMDQMTANNHLKTLAGCGLINFAGHFSGYQLTEQGKAFISGQLIGKNLINWGISPINGTLVEEDILSNSYIVDSSKSGENPINSEKPNQSFSLVDVLAFAPKLFEGSAVSGSGLERVDPMAALTWMAYAWKERQNLTAPCGLIYSRLKSRTKPPEGTDIRLLPNSMLKDLGFEINEPQAQQDDQDELALDPIEKMGPDETVTPAVQELWEKVKAKLGEEMARASFETWLQPTCPVRNNGALYIGAQNTYARDWLENKLGETVNRLLPEYGYQTQVKFVVLESEEI